MHRPLRGFSGLIVLILAALAILVLFFIISGSSAGGSTTASTTTSGGTSANATATNTPEDQASTTINTDLQFTAWLAKEYAPQNGSQ